MDIHEFDDPTGDGDEVTTHRARARTELDQIARQAKQVLAEQEIDLDLFFLIPNSGEAILLYGALPEVDNITWERVGEIVSSVVRQVVGLDGARCRPVICASTDEVASNEHSPMPIPTPALQNTGVEQ